MPGVAVSGKAAFCVERCGPTYPAGVNLPRSTTEDAQLDAIALQAVLMFSAPWSTIPSPYLPQALDASTVDVGPTAAATRAAKWSHGPLRLPRQSSRMIAENVGLQRFLDIDLHGAVLRAEEEGEHHARITPLVIGEIVGVRLGCKWQS
jgi:hypothetical protein